MSTQNLSKIKPAVVQTTKRYQSKKTFPLLCGLNLHHRSFFKEKKEPSIEKYKLTNVLPREQKMTACKHQNAFSFYHKASDKEEEEKRRIADWRLPIRRKINEL